MEGGGCYTGGMMGQVVDQPRFSDFRQHIDELAQAALDGADPTAAVQRYLRRRGRTLLIGEPPDYHTFDLDAGRIFIVAAGKAAVPMTRGALDVLGREPATGVVAAKKGNRDWSAETLGWPVALHLGEHPLPGRNSLRATEAVVEMLSHARANDLVLCLISGGASALLTRPLLPLKDWQRLVEILLKSGCTIGELNAVRRELDGIKGGGLARLAAPAACYGLILSDVIGNAIRDVGSGPTVIEDKPIQSRAMDVLGRYDVARRLDRDAWQKLTDALQKAQLARARSEVTAINYLVGDVRQAATAALVKAIQLGFVGALLTTHMEGEARVLGRLAAAIGRDTAPGVCYVLGGETTVAVRGKGVGGRNQETALAAAIALEGLKNVAVASFGTDGEDGPTDAAGAVVTGATAVAARRYGLDLRASLDDNNSHGLFRRLDAVAEDSSPHLIRTGVTGTNVNDLLFILTYSS